MLKREIKYEDFNGENVSEVVYFNISKPELIELEVEFNEGYGKMLERIIETKDNRELIKRFKEIVLLAYGVKSDDGRRFMKSPTARTPRAISASSIAPQPRTVTRWPERRCCPTTRR